jgi:hypothetical protein
MILISFLFDKCVLIIRKIHGSRVNRGSNGSVWSDSDQNRIHIRFSFSNMNTNIDSFRYEYGSDIKRIRI